MVYNKNMNFVLTAGFLFFSLASFAAVPVCTVKGSSVIQMPPHRDQGPTGDCYAFAARALAQNHYCKTNPCHYNNGNDDTLSVLDAVSLTYRKRIRNGGLTEEVLNAINQEGGMFRESCAPFDVFIRNGELVNNKTGQPVESRITGNVAQNEAKWHFLIRQAMENSSKEGTSAVQRKDIAQKLIRDLGLFHSSSSVCSDCNPRATPLAASGANVCDAEKSFELAIVQNSLTKKDISNVAYELLVPRACADQRLTIKHFTTHSQTFNSADDRRKFIANLLAHGSVVATMICALPPGEIEKAKRLFHDTCGLHSLVVSGIRERCCNGVCSSEYQFYDSAKGFADSEKTDDGWISEKVYFERIGRVWPMLAPNQKRQDITWIE